ncbi:MAG: hypothetical protein IJU60_02595 [Acholeplasmatales bacterium]|nr:hypothetical protein [Acholeplasmatales bacterium]
MQKAITRLFITSMLMLISAITLVASTFAWVGINSTSKWENFEVDLEVVEELEEYGIEVSLTGKEGTFTSHIDQDELKRVILKNYGYSSDYLDTLTLVEIRNLFNEITLDQASVIPDYNTELSRFFDINSQPTKHYIKFDLYISAYKTDIPSEIPESDFYLDAYLKGDLFTGTKQDFGLTHEFEYPSNFVNPALNGIQGGTKVRTDLIVDSASAVRCAFEKFNVVEKYHPERYNTGQVPEDLIIYQGGTQYPTYNPATGVYSFGGCLSDELNVGIFDYNIKTMGTRKTVPDGVKNRGDIEYISTNLNQIVSSNKAKEKIRIDQMMKMTVLFWFEGYDADCFGVVDRSPVRLNIKFVANKENN